MSRATSEHAVAAIMIIHFLQEAYVRLGALKGSDNIVNR